MYINLGRVNVFYNLYYPVQYKEVNEMKDNKCLKYEKDSMHKTNEYGDIEIVTVVEYNQDFRVTRFKDTGNMKVVSVHTLRSGTAKDAELRKELRK